MSTGGKSGAFGSPANEVSGVKCIVRRISPDETVVDANRVDGLDKFFSRFAIHYHGFSVNNDVDAVFCVKRRAANF